MGTIKTKNFYRDKPIFGLDIGHGSLKVMQLTKSGGHSKTYLQGYGTANFDGSALDDGVIKQPEIIAAALKDLFEHHLIGDITTRRVALTIPTYRTFTRAISLPKLKPKDRQLAIETEAERYIPVPLSDLYLDWETISSSGDSQDTLVVAIPKKLVDSYMKLCQLVNLEPVLIETTMHAATRLLESEKPVDGPTMIIDFGSLSSDISLSENRKILVMGTVQGGGESFTQAIKKALDLSSEAAGLIKNKYGIGVSKKQKEIVAALEPTLAPIVKEIERTQRYYQDRFSSKEAISQILILGGGANMPGLSDYLTNNLRLPTRTCDPWVYFESNDLQPPSTSDKPMFSTSTGLAMVNPSEIFA